jgi:hypothetical protein
MSVDIDRSLGNDRADVPDTGTSADLEDGASTAVAEVLDDRAVVEQATGMLMLVYGTDSGRASELLRWHSQQNNLSVPLVAEQVAKSFIHFSRMTPLANRIAYGNLLAHIHRVCRYW